MRWKCHVKRLFSLKWNIALGFFLVDIEFVDGGGGDDPDAETRLWCFFRFSDALGEGGVAACEHRRHRGPAGAVAAPNRGAPETAQRPQAERGNRFVVTCWIFIFCLRCWIGYDWCEDWRKLPSKYRTPLQSTPCRSTVVNFNLARRPNLALVQQYLLPLALALALVPQYL